MGTVLLLALSAGLTTYALVLRLPGYSPRRLMIRRLGAEPAPGRRQPGWRPAIPLAAAAAILLFNALLVYFTPALVHLSRAAGVR